MDPVVYVELELSEVIPLDGFSAFTDLLSTPHQFRSHVALCFCAEGMTKAEDVAGIFNEVQPLNDEWTLEIAVELPDLLPCIDGKSEATVDAADAKGMLHRVCLSNRISRFHFVSNNEPYHAIVPRTRQWHGKIRVGKNEEQMEVASEEQLKTVAAMRFTIRGNSTEHALESSISSCLQTMFECINSLILAVRTCRVAFSPISRTISWGTTPSAYILISGNGPPSGAILALNGARISRNNPMLDASQSDRFRQIANGSTQVSDIDRLIGEAYSSWEYGEYEFAFLQVVIAAEMATARAVRAECIQRGVSKTKLDHNRKEMTYSWALNIGLPLCISHGALPEKRLIDAMNAARSKRNDLMHEGIFQLTREALGQLISDTKEFVAALPSINDAAKPM
ncbi:hypothetical protein NA78x_004311 [Anatilimnocola sp. NA78]|uniref:hypothetical protein n=1 Tax=Anatilimnocola sp. NA78 TaxID=3415683 RepID=UPI003CE4C581